MDRIPASRTITEPPVVLNAVPPQQISLTKPRKTIKFKRNVPVPEQVAGAVQKLYILKNGELKTIKKSNITSSGIIKFIPATSPAPLASPLRPISSKYIVNNDIQSGVMTKEQYRTEVETHRKNQILQRAVVAAAAVDPVTIYKVIRPDDIDLDAVAVEAATDPAVPKRNKPGRKKGGTNKKVEKVSSLLEPAPSGARTRSGRVSRPPRHIQRFYTKDSEGVDGAAKESIYLEDESVEEPPVIKRQKRGIGERFKCDQCGKSYVSERMLSHHVQVAHEMGAGESRALLEGDNMRIDCFNYLLGRLKKVPMKLRGKAFLDEMEVFVDKMHRLVGKLIRRKTCLTEGFLNYSQVHQVPKVLESVLNVPAGQYHFDTQVIDDDEKTILGDANKPEDQHDETAEQHRIQLGNGNKTVVGECESALSGFDDSCTAPTLINHNNSIPNADDNATIKEASFADHIISLEDTIYLPPAVTSGLLSGDGDAGQGFHEDEDDYDEENDDLTTPKKGAQPSPSTRRLKKRVIKELNKSSSFPVPGEVDRSRNGKLSSGLAMSHGEATTVMMTPAEVVFHRPVIKDLSMELFHSASRGGSGGGSGVVLPNQR